MARRHRRFRGGIGGLVRFPGLGLVPSVKTPVKPLEVAGGAIIGLAAGVGIKKASDMLAASGTAVPSFVAAIGPITGGVIAGAAAYAVRRKKNKSQAMGLAVGSILGGLVVTAYGYLQSSGMLNGLVRFPGLSGQYFTNPRMAGFRGPIFANPQSQMNLGRLAQMQGLGDDNEDGLFPAP